LSSVGDDAVSSFTLPDPMVHLTSLLALRPVGQSTSTATSSTFWFQVYAA